MKNDQSGAARQGQGSGGGRRGTGGAAGRGRGAGGGRMGGRGMGPSGECLCPQCGATAPHQRGAPCFEQKCPQCGTAMVRK